MRCWINTERARRSESQSEPQAEAGLRIVTVHLPQITALLAAFTGLCLQPTSELVLKRIKLAGSFRRCLLRLNDFVLQIVTDGVPRQSAWSADLADRESVP